jgi:hypothetical protein
LTFDDAKVRVPRDEATAVPPLLLTSAGVVFGELLLTDRDGAPRTTMALLAGFIVARTRFLSGVAALAPVAKSMTMISSEPERNQDMSCTSRITYASKELLFFAFSGQSRYWAVLRL